MIYQQLRELVDARADQIRERYPRIPRRVSGYNLDSLLPEQDFDVARALAGSESTLVTILHAELRLVPKPAAQALRARDLVGDLHGTEHEPTVRFYDDPEHEKELADVREVALGATARVPDMPDTWEGWEDSAVLPDRLGDYLRDLSKLYDEFGYSGSALYGHFGQGCVHTRIPFDLVTADGIGTFRRFIERAADLVVSYGGSFSGEHGDGQARGELLPKMFGEDLVRAFGQLKAVFDPGNRMNPGKVVAPYRIDENLRLGASWTPRDYDTFFSYPDDDGRFDRAVMRCVGVGKCRHSDGGVMCPSYMATREEEHSTRGRSRLLFEGPVPGLQGLQEGLPRRGRHGHHEGRVPGPPLRWPPAPPGALLDGLAACGGPGRLPGPTAGQRGHPGTRLARRPDRHGRDRPAPPDPAVRRPDAAGLGGRPRSRAFRP